MNLLLACTVVVIGGVVTGVATILCVHPMIKSRALAGVTFIAIAAVAGWASSWIVGSLMLR